MVGYVLAEATGRWDPIESVQKAIAATAATGTGMAAIAGAASAPPPPDDPRKATAAAATAVVEDEFENRAREVMGNTLDAAFDLTPGTAAAVLGVTQLARKRGPSTNPNDPHNATIRAEGAKLEAEGNTILAGGGKLPEKLIKTPGGHLSGRRPDILYKTPTGAVKARQVGKKKKDGTPVPREKKALDDLNGPAGIPTDFVPYN